MKKSIFALTCLFLAIPCSARTIIVDANGTGDYPTIQAAINDANNGDTVVLQPGTYTGPGNRDIDFLGKAITVQSVEPNDPCVVGATIIDCNGTEANPHRGFYFHSSEGPNSVVTGLTITRAFGGLIGDTWLGGAIYIVDSNATIEYCRIINNAGYGGGGIYCERSNPVISNCLIAGNTALEFGSILIDCGGGIGVYGFSRWSQHAEPNIINCTIVGNSAFLMGGGIGAVMSCDITVNNCIIWGNSAPEGHEIGLAPLYDVGNPHITVSYCDVQGGRDEVRDFLGGLHWGPGNLDADPLFINPVGNDYHLNCDSPCVDTGDPNYIPRPNETDMDGDPRVINNRIDMGIDEFGWDKPIIYISPAELIFEAEKDADNPEPQVISIRNSGANTLHWQITEGCAWLEVEPGSGESAGEFDDVNVSVDISGLEAGVYNCELTVSDVNAYNNPQIIQINLYVRVPLIKLSSKEFEFSAARGGPNPDPQVLTIRNSSVGTLNWTISNDCNWLTVEPNSGSSTGEPNEVILSVDVTGLAEGVYDCNLVIVDPCAGNSPQTAEVTLYVCVPVIELSSNEFEFSAPIGGPNPDPQVLTIRNSGMGTLDWTINEACSWLTVEPDSGSSTGEPNDVIISVDVTGLAKGTYYCDLMVVDPCAGNSPEIAEVTLYVCVPAIWLSSDDFEFHAAEGGPNPGPQVLTIRNSGVGTLNWTIDEDCDWLTVEPNNGSSTGEPNTVTLSVDATGLAEGIYDCNLTISDPNAGNSPRTVEVSLVVHGPIIETSATQIIFWFFEGGPNPDDQVLTIRNSGGRTLNWEITYDCNWLTVDPVSGSSSGEPNEVTLSVDITGLAEGIYDCNLTITDPNAENSPQTVVVTLRPECFPIDHPHYARWVEVGRPLCWCYPRQCHGDADDTAEYIKGKGYYYCHFKDLNLLLAAWNVREPPLGPGIKWPDPKICADFGHNLECIKGGLCYRVHFWDLNILISNWNVREPLDGPGIEPNCP